MHFQVVNAVGAIGSTVNKFYMCLHRYFVLRDIAVNEDVQRSIFFFVKQLC